MEYISVMQFASKHLDNYYPLITFVLSKAIISVCQLSIYKREFFSCNKDSVMFLKRRRYISHILFGLSLIILALFAIFLRGQNKQYRFVNRKTSNEFVISSRRENDSSRNGTGGNSVDPNLRSLMSSNWMQYRNNWNGEELVSIADTEKLIFSKRYRPTMIEKGLHWITESIPEFADRYRSMKNNCKFLRKDGQEDSISITGRRLMYVDRYELLACNIPKASSTTFTQTFMKLDQGTLMNETNIGPGGYKLNISMANHKEEHYMNAKRIQTYLKVALTRHPFSWIGSKYHFRAANSANSEFQKEDCPYIIKRLYLEGFPTNEQTFIKTRERKYGNMNDDEFRKTLFQIRRYNAAPGYYNITLLEYINALLLKPKNSFQGQVRLCNPCAMHFDIILQCTNGYEEINKVLDFLQRDKPYEKRIHYPQGSPLVSKAKCNEEYSAIPMETRQRLYTFLEQDFVLFGYKFENDPNSPNACY